MALESVNHPSVSLLISAAPKFRCCPGVIPTCGFLPATLAGGGAACCLRPKMPRIPITPGTSSVFCYCRQCPVFSSPCLSLALLLLDSLSASALALRMFEVTGDRPAIDIDDCSFVADPSITELTASKTIFAWLRESVGPDFQVALDQPKTRRNAYSNIVR